MPARFEARASVGTIAKATLPFQDFSVASITEVATPGTTRWNLARFCAVNSSRCASTQALAERHVSRQLRLAYLAPGVLKRLVYKREVPAVTLLKLTDVAALPWHEQPKRVFD